ncbi:MAG: DUF692 domain-containing protein [Thiolinea sp.]
MQYCGIGLRFEHIDQVLNERPAIPWLEVISDNFMQPGTVQQDYLLEVAAHYPLSLHGVGLSLGSMEPLNQAYLTQLKQLADTINPLRISDHLCWTNSHGVHSHDLLPLPYTDTTVQHVADRIKQVQDYLGRELVVENVSSYLQYTHSAMPEWVFVNQVLEAADCGLLLDVNNIYVSAFNHGFAAQDYLAVMPVERVREVHLAGYSDRGTHLLDTHSQPVSDPVWALYQQFLQTTATPVPTLIEWDIDIPPLEILLQEAAKADALLLATHPQPVPDKSHG